MNAFSIGLGKLTVFSSLNQPFDAEIELVDVGNIPLAGIKASLASEKDYDRANVEQSLIADQLVFMIESNKQGKPVVRIHSVNRISEPYFQILVDLAWSKGQVDREYSILLDPPDYDFIVQKTRRLVKRIEPSANADDPASFAQKDEEHTSNVQEVASPRLSQHTEYSRSEHHLKSRIPSAPILVLHEPFMPKGHHYLSAPDDLNSTHSAKALSSEKHATLLAQMNITQSAIESITESNAILKEQLRMMQKQNKKLLDQLSVRDKKLAALNKQLIVLLHRNGLAGQVIQSEEKHSHHWLWLLILLGVIGGSLMAWRQWGDALDGSQFYNMYIRRRFKGSHSIPVAKEVPPTVTPQETTSTEKEPSNIPQIHSEEQTAKAPSSPPKQKIDENSKDNHVIEFTHQPDEPIKSAKALQTMLSLAKTYIEMGDTVTAKQTLEEVLNHGNEKQKIAAQKLLNSIISS